MASPQAENGYTRIANEIMEAMAKYRLSGQERQIVDVVLRKTYGFNKTEDVISMGQFSICTGINRPLVARLLKSLLHKKILRVTQKDNTNGNSYIFQKDFDKWGVLHKKITRSKGVTQNDNKSVINLVLLGVTQNDTYKRQIQQKTKDKKGVTQNDNTCYPEWLPMETFNDFKEMREKKKKPLTEKSETLIIKKLEELKNIGNDPRKVLEQSIMYSWQGIFEVKKPQGETSKQESQYATGLGEQIKKMRAEAENGR